MIQSVMPVSQDNDSESVYSDTDNNFGQSNLFVEQTGSSSAVPDHRTPLWILPILIGAFLLVINTLLINPGPLRYAFPGTFGGWIGSVSVLLVTASVFTGVFLIVYAFVLRRTETSDGRGNDAPQAWFVRWVVVPVVLGILAVLGTAWSLNNWQGAYESRPLKSCLDAYEQAQSIRKANPVFRMPASDSQEQRCRVNAVLGF